jgi:hypothetical protein
VTRSWETLDEAQSKVMIVKMMMMMMMMIDDDGTSIVMSSIYIYTDR